jgi:16S rRNA C967 or C1407 C5-methylase (RsmB/RsmF family)
VFVHVFLVSHRDAVFAHVPPADRARMQLDEVSQYSVSDAVCADATSEWIRRVLTAAAEEEDGAATAATPTAKGRAPFRITDACSCVGGNTLSFSRTFEQVHASETHPGRLAMLKDNCKLAGADSRNIWRHTRAGQPSLWLAHWRLCGKFAAAS